MASKDGSKLYQDFFKAFKAAHPQLKGSEIQEKVNLQWSTLKREIKGGDLTNFNEQISSLRLKTARLKSESSILSFFVKSSSKKTNQSPNVQQQSSGPTSSTEDTKPDACSSATETLEPTQTSSKAATAVVAETPSSSGSSATVKTPAQDLIRKKLDSVNAKIVSIVSVKNTVGLSSDLKRDYDEYQKEKETLEKKLKRKLIEQKSQAKSREKKSIKIQKLAEQAGVEPATLTRTKPGRPRVEEEKGMENLAEEIYRIVVPEGAADERRRTETVNTIQTIDGLKNALEKKGYSLSRTALYYRLLPSNISHIDGKRHFSTVNVKLSRPQNNQRKGHVDDHFAFATLKYAKELANLFGSQNCFFLSQDDKARVPIGLPISKKQSVMLMHLDYKVTLPDHDFPIGENHKLIPSVYACCLPDKQDQVGYSGPTFVAVRSAKHNKSSAESHIQDFNRLLEIEAFKDHIHVSDSTEVKPLVFISVDGGPDEAPKNTKTLTVWANQFQKMNLDACFIFTRAPGSSAYNPVERRMAPLSKMTASVILPFDTFGSHLNSANKTVDVDLERANFEAAGKILADIFNESEIDGYPVVSEFVASENDEVENAMTEKWKTDHVIQSQYMCQIVKCLDPECCSPFRTNYCEIFPQRFLPPPVPVKACPGGLKIDPTGHFGSLFQALHFFNLETMKPSCFDEYCPSLSKKDAVGITILQKRMCPFCSKYHSTIKSMNAHKRVCKKIVCEKVLTEDDDDDDDDDVGAEEENTIIPSNGRNIFDILNDTYNI